MIIRGGENIYPREIEEALLAQPSIKDVAIVGLPDAKLGEVVGAFVVTDPTQPFDREQVAEQLRQQLAKFKIPQHWMVADELPRTPTGKIQKFVLLDQWKSGDINALTDETT